MTQKVMLAAASQCFEFDGEITEIEQDYIVLKGKHGDILIERKYLVFIQYLEDEKPVNTELPKPAHICCPWCSTRHVDIGEWETRPHHKHLCLTCKKIFRVEGENGEYFYGVSSDYEAKSPNFDAAAKFISKRLKHDPVNEELEQKFIPPSQLPDGESPEDFRQRFNAKQEIEPDYETASPFLDDDDEEIMKNVASGKHMWNDTAITNAPDLRQAIKTAMKNEDQDFSMGMGGSKYKNPAQTILGMKNAGTKKDRGR